MRRNLLFAAGVGLFIVGCSLFLQAQFSRNDLWLAYGSAELLLNGQNPYDYPTNDLASYPVPTILLMVPFVALGIPLTWTGAIVFGLSSSILVYGILRTGEYWRLLTLASWPYWFCVIYSQWPPLILAIMYLPILVPLTLVKPHIGLPVGLLNLTWRNAIITGLILIGTFFLVPNWVHNWLNQTSTFDGISPIITFAGMICAVCLAWAVLYRGHTHTRWWYALAYLLVPQRLWHDPLMLWYLPLRAWHMILLTACSWIVLFLPGVSWQHVGVLFYLPATVGVVWSLYKQQKKDNRLDPLPVA